MHSFLSKVFGRKKDEKETSPTTLAPGELLGGKFEAVSPTVSPSAAKFLDLDQNNQKAAAAALNGLDKDKDKDNKEPSSSSFLSKVISRPSSPEVKPVKKLDNLPHLSLNLGGAKEEEEIPNNDDLEAFLDVDPEAQTLLSDAVIGERRLNPMEALLLIRACSQAIVSRGLETLGIMHPHWYSSSPDVQRKLISQFIHSLNPRSPTNSLSLTPALLSPFDSEIESTRDPHDIAAVLRWGLRHLQLNSEHLGTDEGWYKAFLDAEAAAEYPPKAFSEKLAPQLPKEHLEMLTATLEIFSSLAAHSEANSTSGSKLSKIFGLWLLTARRIEHKDDWHSFYTRWEHTGRMLEHLFLARIRDESTDQRMPVRLLELVRKYPYTQGLSSPHTDLQLLPPSRFTTQHHDALFVRVEIELPSPSSKGKGKAKADKKRVHPIALIADAFSIKPEDGEEFAELWKKITEASKNGSNPSPLSNVFSDETIRFLNMIPREEKQPKSPTFSLLPMSASPPSSPHKRAFTTDETGSRPGPTATPNHAKPATDPTSESSSPLSPISLGDWAQFSASGFLDTTSAIGPLVSTLFDQDLEKTIPPEPTPGVTERLTLSRKSSKRAAKAPTPRKSIDITSPDKDKEKEKDKELANGVEEKNDSRIKLTKFQIVELDEAFIDFWSDALLDPISSDWPSFVICKFRSSLVSQLVFAPIPTPATNENEHKPRLIKWLVLEQVYTSPAPPPPPPPPNTAILPSSASVDPAPALGSPRPVSPTQSTSGKKRFSFWSSISRTTSDSSVSSQKGAASTSKKEKGATLRVGEMGELIEEEGDATVKGDEEHSGKSVIGSIIKLKSPSFKSRRSSDAKRPAESIKSVDREKERRASIDDTKKTAADTVLATAATTAVVTGALATGAALAAVPEDKPLTDVAEAPKAVDEVVVVIENKEEDKKEDEQKEEAKEEVVKEEEAKKAAAENDVAVPEEPKAEHKEDKVKAVPAPVPEPVAELVESAQTEAEVEPAPVPAPEIVESAAEPQVVTREIEAAEPEAEAPAPAVAAEEHPVPVVEPEVLTTTKMEAQPEEPTAPVPLAEELTGTQTLVEEAPLAATAATAVVVAAAEVKDKEEEPSTVAEVETESAAPIPVIQEAGVDEEKVEPAPVPVALTEEKEEEAAAAPAEAEAEPTPVSVVTEEEKIELPAPVALAEEEPAAEEKAVEEEVAIAPAEAEPVPVLVAVEDLVAGEPEVLLAPADADSAPASIIEEVSVEEEVESTAVPVAVSEEGPAPIAEEKGSEEAISAEAEPAPASVAQEAVAEEKVPEAVALEEPAPIAEEKEVAASADTEFTPAPVVEEVPVVEQKVESLAEPIILEEPAPITEAKELEEVTTTADVAEAEPVITTAVQDASIEEEEVGPATEQAAVEEPVSIVQEKVAAEIEHTTTPSVPEEVVEEKVESAPSSAVVVEEPATIAEENEVEKIDAAPTAEVEPASAPVLEDVPVEEEKLEPAPVVLPKEERAPEEKEVEMVELTPVPVVEAAAEGEKQKQVEAVHEPIALEAVAATIGEEVSAEVAAPAEVKLTIAPVVDDAAVEEEKVESFPVPATVEEPITEGKEVEEVPPTPAELGSAVLAEVEGQKVEPTAPVVDVEEPTAESKEVEEVTALVETETTPDLVAQGVPVEEQKVEAAPAPVASAVEELMPPPTVKEAVIQDKTVEPALAPVTVAVEEQAVEEEKNESEELSAVPAEAEAPVPVTVAQEAASEEKVDHASESTALEEPATTAEERIMEEKAAGAEAEAEATPAPVIREAVEELAAEEVKEVQRTPAEAAPVIEAATFAEEKPGELGLVIVEIASAENEEVESAALEESAVDEKEIKELIAIEAGPTPTSVVDTAILEEEQKPSEPAPTVDEIVANGVSASPVVEVAALEEEPVKPVPDVEKFVVEESSVASPEVVVPPAALDEQKAKQEVSVPADAASEPEPVVEGAVDETQVELVPVVEEPVAENVVEGEAVEPAPATEEAVSTEVTPVLVEGADAEEKVEEEDKVSVSVIKGADNVTEEEKDTSVAAELASEPAPEHKIIENAAAPDVESPAVIEEEAPAAKDEKTSEKAVEPIRATEDVIVKEAFEKSSDPTEVEQAIQEEKVEEEQEISATTISVVEEAAAEDNAPVEEDKVIPTAKPASLVDEPVIEEKAAEEFAAPSDVAPINVVEEGIATPERKWTVTEAEELHPILEPAAAAHVVEDAVVEEKAAESAAVSDAISADNENVAAEDEVPEPEMTSAAAPVFEGSAVEERMAPVTEEPIAEKATEEVAHVSEVTSEPVAVEEVAVDKVSEEKEEHSSPLESAPIAAADIEEKATEDEEKASAALESISAPAPTVDEVVADEKLSLEQPVLEEHNEETVIPSDSPDTVEETAAAEEGVPVPEPNSVAQPVVGEEPVEEVVKSIPITEESAVAESVAEDIAAQEKVKEEEVVAVELASAVVEETAVEGEILESTPVVEEPAVENKAVGHMTSTQQEVEAAPAVLDVPVVDEVISEEEPVEHAPAVDGPVVDNTAEKGIALLDVPPAPVVEEIIDDEEAVKQAPLAEVPTVEESKQDTAATEEEVIAEDKIAGAIPPSVAVEENVTESVFEGDPAPALPEESSEKEKVAVAEEEVSVAEPAPAIEEAVAEDKVVHEEVHPAREEQLSAKEALAATQDPTESTSVVKGPTVEEDVGESAAIVEELALEEPVPAESPVPVEVAPPPAMVVEDSELAVEEKGGENNEDVPSVAEPATSTTAVIEEPTVAVADTEEPVVEAGATEDAPASEVAHQVAEESAAEKQTTADQEEVPAEPTSAPVPVAEDLLVEENVVEPVAIVADIPSEETNEGAASDVTPPSAPVDETVNEKEKEGIAAHAEAVPEAILAAEMAEEVPVPPESAADEPAPTVEDPITEPAEDALVAEELVVEDKAVAEVPTPADVETYPVVEEEAISVPAPESAVKPVETASQPESIVAPEEQEVAEEKVDPASEPVEVVVIDSAENELGVAVDTHDTPEVGIDYSDTVHDGELVDLPPVPLVDTAPVQIQDDAHITIPLQESSPAEVALATAESVVEEHSVKEVPVAPDIPESVALSGTTPGPELALSSTEGQDILATSDKVEALDVPLDITSNAGTEVETVNGNGHHATSGGDTIVQEESESVTDKDDKLYNAQDSDVKLIEPVEPQTILAEANGHDSKTDV